MLQDERGPENSGEGGRKAPKTGGGAPSSSPPTHRRSPGGSSRGPWPPPPAAWEGGEVRRDRSYPQPPPPQPQQQEHQAAHQRPQAYSGPYLVSRNDPRGAAGEYYSAPPVAAAAGGRGRDGSVGRGGNSGGRSVHPADDQGEDESVFPHYAAPAGRRDGRRSGGVHGGAPPAGWSRQLPQHPHGPPPQLHPVRSGGQGAIDGQVVAPLRRVPSAATTSAAASAAVATAPEQGGRGVTRPGAGASGDYYDHPFYQRERDSRGDGGMTRGGGRGRGAGGRMPYTDAGPPPYARPPQRILDRTDRSISGGRSGGGVGDRPRSPVHVGARSGSRGHPMGPSDRGDVLPLRYVRPAQPGINRALCEAVERIFDHREKLAGAGGGGHAAEDPNTDVVERRAGAGSSPALDAKKATMRIITMLESFDGRLNDMMADPRAMAELDTIFPGVEEGEFRALLEGCIERSQVSLYVLVGRCTTVRTFLVRSYVLLFCLVVL